MTTYAYIDYGKQALTFMTYNYTLPAGGSIVVNGTINAIDDTNGDYLHFNILAVLTNDPLNITIYEYQDFYVEVVPNAILSSSYMSGLIGTNFTGMGAQRSSPVQTVNLPNASYFDNSFGMGQIYGINEDLYRLFIGAQTFKSYYEPGQFFMDAAATLYISSITYFTLTYNPNVPQDILSELWYVLYSGIVYYFP